MRFMRFRIGKRTGLAVQHDGAWTGLTADHPHFPGDLDDLFADGQASLARAFGVLRQGAPVDIEAVEFLPPLQRPSKIICVGLNYRNHIAESGLDTPTYPTLFARWPSGVIAHGAPLVRPLLSDTLDYEGELVAVIGTGGRHIPAAQALDHVAGYSIFNDGSVRAYQMQTTQWTTGKNFDGTGAFGPWFVTADELPLGARGLRLQTRLNGQVMQDASTAELLFDVATLIALISDSTTLVPGDLIVTGTPSGVGAARKPPVFMKAGDICEVEIEGLGILRNRVVDEVRDVH